MVCGKREKGQWLVSKIEKPERAFNGVGLLPGGDPPQFSFELNLVGNILALTLQHSGQIRSSSSGFK